MFCIVLSYVDDDPDSRRHLPGPGRSGSYDQSSRRSVIPSSVHVHVHVCHMRVTKYMYHIVLNNHMGVYFLPEVLDLALL